MSELEPLETKPTVLVVDDDLAARLMTQEALEQAGFEVFEAEDGIPALEIFKARKIDVVLLDVMMINLDGFETCAAIRRMETGLHVPIMMMTGLEDFDSVNRAYNVGATDFVTKPINYFALAYRVRYVLRASRMSDALRESEARLAKAQRMAKLGHWEWNLGTKRLLCSPQVERLFGLRDGSIVPGYESFLQRAHPEDVENLEPLLKRAIEDEAGIQASFRVVLEGRVTCHVHLEATSYRSADGTELFFAGTIQDITELRRAEQQAHRLAYFDALTGLPNRAGMRQELGRLLSVAGQHEREVAVIALDIDNFKRINDTLGRSAGDKVLKNVAARLARGTRTTESRAPGHMRVSGLETDFIARTGGDEFVVVLTDIKSAEESAVIAKRLRDAIVEPVNIAGEEIVVSTTMGISVFPLDGTEAEELVTHADSAKNHAKEEGRGHYQFYTAAINARAFRRLSLETAMRRALQMDQLELFYQPKMELASDRVIGAEALVRWHHPDQGLIGPVDFIPIAEETGLIVPLGEWILRDACRLLADWHRRGLPALHVAVNLSAIQFKSAGLLGAIRGSTREFGVDPNMLEVELTESLLMQDTEMAVNLLREIKALGHDIWIDDFGTGYSSLAYLQSFPLAGLKIDKSFVREMDTNDHDGSIVGAIIALAHSLRLSVVAEGVETVEHQAALRARGCDVAQGYLYSRPVPASEFEEWVLDWERSRIARA
ncbi:MAG: EAL domain-containing protein [Gammaproteobacteria bacterium]|nr:EAL domain-containing protein [Gammaproteobacteria bacterium]MBI5617433.1 EAL domain-containing protein [Gammaproteobacteria bacterium]